MNPWQRQFMEGVGLVNSKESTLYSVGLTLGHWQLNLIEIRDGISQSLLTKAINFFPSWLFGPIPGHCPPPPPLRGFAITLIGHTTLGGNPLDE